LEKDGVLSLISPDVDYEAVRAGEYSIKGLLAILAGEVQRIGGSFIVIDAVDGLMRLFDDPRRERHELHALHAWLMNRELTSLMTVKSGGDGRLVEDHGFLQFLVDCVVHLDQRTDAQVTTRRLRVLKYRGSGYSSNEHPIVIGDQGVAIMPVTSIELSHKPSGSPVSSGEGKLDAVLGGGYRRGSSVLISGPTGSGKTTLACMFTDAACRRGERCLYVSFEESSEALSEGMKSVGLDLRSLVEAGTLEILTAMPEATGVEQHLLRILEVLDRFRPHHLVADALSATGRMGSERAAFDFLVRLLSACKERSITCVYTNQASYSRPTDKISSFGISSLIDTVVLLSYVDDGRELKRSLLVLKSRATKHSSLHHSFRITDNGITLEEPSVPLEFESRGS
jgi:circadian clock protein KaiC